MNIPSLKDLAMPATVNRLCALSRNANAKPQDSVSFAQELSVILVDYIFKDPLMALI